MKYIIASIIIGLSLSSFSQSVRITCPKSKLRKNPSFGYLNLKGTSLGDIYAIKANRKRIKSIRPLGHKDVASSNINLGDSVKLKETTTTIDFILNASADLSSDVVAEVENQLDSELNFKLYQSITQTIKDPSIQISYYDPEIFPIKSGEKYALINRITIADSLTIKTKTGLDLKAGGKFKFGEVNVAVTNDCDDLVRLAGDNTSVFFEYLVFEPTITTKRVKEVSISSQGNPRYVDVKVATWRLVEDYISEELLDIDPEQN